MKILEVILSLKDAGAERFVVDLSNEFHLQNHETIVLSFYEIKEEFFLKNELNPKIKLQSVNKQLGLDFKILPKLYKLIREEKPDIIHTHMLTLNYILLIKLIIWKLKIVHTVHNDAYKEASWFVRKLRWGFYKIKFVTPVTISKASKESYLKAYKIDPPLIDNGTRRIKKSGQFKQVVTIYQEIIDNPDEIILVNIARITEQKNQVMLVEVVNELNNSGYNLNLFILGGVRDYEIKMKIEKIKTERIHLLGSLQNATDYLFIADFFCLSSKWEGMPITLIESFSSGCIPVCTPVGGINNMIQHEKNGFIANSPNKEAYCGALIQAINVLKYDKKRLKDIKQNCKITFEKYYSINNCANNYFKLFSSLIYRKSVNNFHARKKD